MARELTHVVAELEGKLKNLALLLLSLVLSTHYGISAPALHLPSQLFYANTCKARMDGEVSLIFLGDWANSFVPKLLLLHKDVVDEIKQPFRLVAH